jgi:uncharacterized protein YndB with AHSA1/START domain
MQTSNETHISSSIHKASTTQSRLLEIKREFKVPVRRLFEAFKTAEALKTWWWPNNIYADHIDYDFREGGHYYMSMKGFGDGRGGMTGHFEEIVEEKRIVMTDQFADKNGQPISAKEAKMPGDWPSMVYITFDFQSVDENTGRLVLSQQGIPNELQKDCIQGWSESFDKLDHYLGGRDET